MVLLDDDENDPITLSKDEMKRVDHLIYVSLKYTRTCDVFKNILTRMISAIDFALDAILKNYLTERRIAEIPSQPKVRCATIKENTEDEMILELLDKYNHYRRLNVAEFTRAREFRRHVTMTCKIEGKDTDVSIDSITEEYHRLKELLTHVTKLIQGEGE